MKVLDMRGQPCPIPVVNAKKALFEPTANGFGNSSVVVLVDNMAAVQNLEKMAKGTGFAFLYEEDGASYKVSIFKNANNSQVYDEPLQAAIGTEARGPVVLITSDSMGKGAEELGQLLIKGFIFSLSQLNPAPEAVIFLNSGIRLAMEGANTVPDLKTLKEKGSELYICGTCANYYQLTNSLAVGDIVDMMIITNYLAKASGVITI